jgi:Ser-tRNA(Ala) deacylase AlaX
LTDEKQGTDIAYMLPTNHTLHVGDEVQLRIDWDTRYRLMKLHFAAELVLVCVNQLLNHPEKIGANITADKARIDFVWRENITQIFPTLEKKLKEIIEADLPITSAFSDEETERRFREIEGFAKVPCGGTHLKRTGEI